jgi:hypothetical protein
MSLLRSWPVICAASYKDFAPTELTASELPWLPRCQDVAPPELTRYLRREL